MFFDAEFDGKNRLEVFFAPTDRAGFRQEYAKQSKGIDAGLFILLTSLAGSSYLDRIMNLLPLRAVGVVGYSFYLLHPLMIDCVRSASDYFYDYYPTKIALFVLAGLATYAVSVFTYSYVERPFIKK